MVGATVLCVLAVEACARGILATGLLPPPRERTRFDEAAPQADGAQPWMATYRRELDAAWAVRWEPYVYWVSKPFSGEYVNIDADGRRKTWTDATVHPKRRLFVFGGSTIWGRGARDEFTIPSFLAKELARDANTRFAVTNHGQSGYVSTQEVLSLLLELRRGNIPDAVVFYDGVNDVFATYQEGVAGTPQNESKRRMDFEAFEQALLARVTQRLGIFQLLSRAAGVDPLAARPPGASSDWGALGAATLEAYEGNLRIVDALARDFGFRAYYFWQPVVWSKTSVTPFEAEIQEAYAPLADIYRATYGQVAARSFLSSHPRFVDLSHALDSASSDTADFFDYCHVLERGNERIAAAMAAAIRSGESATDR